MKLEKTSEKYTLFQEGIRYILNLGNIKKGENTQTTIRVSEIDAKQFSVQSTCGCSVATSEIISPTEVEIKVAYKNCDQTFAKTIKLNQGKLTTQLLIKGNCQ